MMKKKINAFDIAVILLIVIGITGIIARIVRLSKTEFKGEEERYVTFVSVMDKEQADSLTVGGILYDGNTPFGYLKEGYSITEENGEYTVNGTVCCMGEIKEKGFYHTGKYYYKNMELSLSYNGVSYGVILLDFE